MNNYEYISVVDEIRLRSLRIPIFLICVYDIITSMRTDDEIIKESIQYFNENKQDFLKTYTKGIEQSEYKGAIFTAGMSGVGKTE